MRTGKSHCEAAERVYTFMLGFYPPSFRHHFGTEMLQVFRESYQSYSRGSGLAALRNFWIWTIEDWLRSVLGEWQQVLVRLNKIEHPLRSCADALIVPLMVLGALLVAGSLAATLVRNLAMPATAGPGAEARNAASMLAAGVGVVGALGGVSGLRAFIAARNRRAESWIKL